MIIASATMLQITQKPLDQCPFNCVKYIVNNMSYLFIYISQIKTNLFNVLYKSKSTHYTDNKDTTGSQDDPVTQS